MLTIPFGARSVTRERVGTEYQPWRLSHALASPHLNTFCVSPNHVAWYGTDSKRRGCPRVPLVPLYVPQHPLLKYGNRAQTYISLLIGQYFSLVVQLCIGHKDRIPPPTSPPHFSAKSAVSQTSICFNPGISFIPMAFKFFPSSFLLI